MTTPLISLCVPMYNVAPYIERCVRSIMEQTYDNIEYIFVDDGSTDSTIAILKKVLLDYPQRKGRTKIIENGHNYGTAYTRRVYIENARGDYILSVDSDDYIDKNMVQCLIDKALDANAEIVVAGFSHESNIIEIKEPFPIDNATDCIYLVLAGLLNSMCGRLIRRSLFTEGRKCYAPNGLDYMEDRLMFLYLTSKAQKIVTENKPLYHYVSRTDSITQNKNEQHFIGLIRFWQEADKLLEELGFTEKYKYIVGAQKIEDKAFLLMHCDSNRTRRKYMNLYAAEERYSSPNLSRGVALMYWLIKHRLWFLTYCYQRYIRWLEHKKYAQKS